MLRSITLLKYNSLVLFIVQLYLDVVLFVIYHLVLVQLTRLNKCQRYVLYCIINLITLILRRN